MERPTYPVWFGDPVTPPSRAPRARFGISTVALVVGAGLLGGLIGARVAPPASVPAPSVAPVVRPVVASESSTVERVEAVATGLLPVTVQIRTGDGTGDGAGGATGSGVIMSADGYVLTNSHVIEGPGEVTVVLPSSEPLRGQLVGADPANDLAVVRVDRTGLPVAVFGSSAELRIGELAVAVGSPFGLQGSVTAGVVSALHRVVDLGNGEQLVNAIQTDASINPGNSGGALANGDGEVIGINTAIATSGMWESNVGVGFAIPIDLALEVAEDLIAGRTVRTPLLGVVGGADLTPEIAEQYGLTGLTGALIESVEPNSPAERAGIRAGDLVTKVGDTGVQGWDGLVVAVHQAEVGQPVPVVVVRDGTEIELTVTPTEKP